MRYAGKKYMDFTKLLLLKQGGPFEQYVLRVPMHILYHGIERAPATQAGAHPLPAYFSLGKIHWCVKLLDMRH